MMLGMLFVGLYPFNYFPLNQVSINEDGSGLSFHDRGIAYTTGSSVWPAGIGSEESLTLELKLKPERSYNQDIPHILSLCDDAGKEVIYLGQWKNSLIVRLIEDSRWIEKINKEIGTGDVLKAGESIFITIVLEKDTAGIYVNGQLKREFTRFEFSKAVSKRPIRSLVLGNASDGDSPWQGMILRFSVINSALDAAAVMNRYKSGGLSNFSHTRGEFIKYLLEDSVGRIINNQAGKGWDLIVPETLSPLRREFLSLPSRIFLQSRHFYEDAIVNLVGFVPLGFFLTLFFSGIPFKKHLYVIFMFPVLVGGLLSLFIETNQVFLISRSSSMTDLVLNILGAGLGIGVYWMGKRGKVI
jgi:hypothetical protein